MDPLKEFIHDMQEGEIIINKGKGTTESFYLNEKPCDNNIHDGNESQNSDEVTNNVMTFTDDSFNEILLK